MAYYLNYLKNIKISHKFLKLINSASQSKGGGDILSRAEPPVGFEPSCFQVGAVQEAAYTGSTGQWGEEERIHSIEY